MPALVTALTALITALAALRKPPDTTAPRATYEELSRLMEQLEEAVAKNHADIVALRGFINGYMMAREGGQLSDMVLDKDAGSRPPGRTERPDGRKPRSEAGVPVAKGRPRLAPPDAPDNSAEGTQPAALRLPPIQPLERVARPRSFKDLLHEAERAR